MNRNLPGFAEWAQKDRGPYSRVDPSRFSIAIKAPYLSAESSSQQNKGLVLPLINQDMKGITLTHP